MPPPPRVTAAVPLQQPVTRYLEATGNTAAVTVFSGMLASTCLAVLFAPAFFVVVQHLEEWRGGRVDAW